MQVNDKKMKALMSGVITGNKEKTDSHVKELVESILLEKETAIFESFFRNVANSGKEKNKNG